MKKVIALAIASAMVAPAAFAAEDKLGMKYTSASEGFYASIRQVLHTNTGTKDTGAYFNGTGRIGLRGDNDLGGGLGGFYRWEGNVANLNGGVGLQTRLLNAGLSGNFGNVVIGTFYDAAYNHVSSKSDIAQWNSGNFPRNARVNRSIQYNTPDLNGFTGSLQLKLEDGKQKRANSEAEITAAGVAAGEAYDDLNATAKALAGGDRAAVVTAGAAAARSTLVYTDKDGNQLDQITVAGTYAIAGFTFSAAYDRTVDGLTPASPRPATAGAAIGGVPQPGAAIPATGKDDLDFWGVGSSYGQDNWNVGGWYGVQDQRRITGTGTTADPWKIGDDDLETFSVGGNVAVDKITVYGVWEQQENQFGHDDDTRAAGAATNTLYESSYAALGVVYFIGSNSRVWLEYASQDVDSNPLAEDYLTIGLRHDF